MSNHTPEDVAALVASAREILKEYCPGTMRLLFDALAPFTEEKVPTLVEKVEAITSYHDTRESDDEPMVRMSRADLVAVERAAALEREKAKQGGGPGSMGPDHPEYPQPPTSSVPEPVCHCGIVESEHGMETHGFVEMEMFDPPEPKKEKRRVGVREALRRLLDDFEHEGWVGMIPQRKLAQEALNDEPDWKELLGRVIAPGIPEDALCEARRQWEEWGQ